MTRLSQLPPTSPPGQEQTHELIRVGAISVRFLTSRHDTDGVLDLFETTLPPHVHILVPHLHRDYDETIIGMDGITTWTVDGIETQLRPGEQLFIPRGVVHSFANRHDTASRMMCILTPGLIGPEYFMELAEVFDADGPPNIARLGTVMTRYGVVPVSSV